MNINLQDIDILECSFIGENSFEEEQLLIFESSFEIIMFCIFSMLFLIKKKENNWYVKYFIYVVLIVFIKFLIYKY